MRTLVISILVFLAASISLIPASGQPAEANPSEKQQSEEPEHTAAISTVDDPNAEAASDPNAADDSNNVGPTVEDFKGLERELGHISRASREEIRLWTSRTEDKLDLALAVQQQITTELNFLRQLAVEEGAVKTTVSIDRILSDRQERYKGIVEKLEREKERLRREGEREREERNRERDRGRRRSR